MFATPAPELWSIRLNAIVAVAPLAPMLASPPPLSAAPPVSRM